MSEYHEQVQQLIDDWQGRFGVNIKVSRHWIDGSAYREKPEQWFGESDLFRVGPLPDIESIISELTRLHELNSTALNEH